LLHFAICFVVFLQYEHIKDQSGAGEVHDASEIRCWVCDIIIILLWLQVLCCKVLFPFLFYIYCNSFVTNKFC